MKRHTKSFCCGTSNVVLPVPNKTHFPPEFSDKSRLCYYASLFNSVEINSSFYKIPMARTVEKWANDVPTDFKFTFKLWKGITHAKELNFNVDDVQRFMRCMDAAGTKKGCLLVQFPAGIKANHLGRLEQLLYTIRDDERQAGWQVAVEFRDRSWYAGNVYDLLQSCNAAMVVHDMPRAATPALVHDTSFVYLRFHGERGDYRGGYTDDFLQEYATYIQAWIKEGKKVYAYFNNTLGEAVHNARTLAAYVG